jgi:pimeloyl-ACP methyl ester carboxylesterase
MADDHPGETVSPPSLEEDQPRRTFPEPPPEIASPLAPFEGRSPPRPAWFTAALAKAPERSKVPVEGAGIELLTWGELGKPGVILVHGNSAHADWWSFIAPYLADTHRVAALSLSGMGGSDWRDVYSFETFATEIFECAKAAGLYEGGQKPIYIGHSFGGAQTFYSAARHPDRMRACMLVDTGFGGPPTAEELERWEKEEVAAGGKPGRFRPGPSQRAGPNRVYPTLEAALTRFRFMPPQVPGNLYVADFIARQSLRRTPMPDGSGEGWTWKFDPGLWSKLDRSGLAPIDADSVTTPLAHVYGENSAIIRRHGTGGRSQSQIPASTPRIVIPDSEHHVMVDQPLALISAMRALLAVWPTRGSGQLEAPGGLV